MVLPLATVPVLVAGALVGLIATKQAYRGITQTSKDDLERGYISVSVAHCIATACSAKYAECSTYRTLTAINFGYSSATPPALKWFPPARTGLIAGLVVSGFGLASVYIAPLATWLVRTYGLQQAMLFFGVGFLFVVSGLSMLLTNPPAGLRRRRGCRSGLRSEIRLHLPFRKW